MGRLRKSLKQPPSWRSCPSLKHKNCTILTLKWCVTSQLTLSTRTFIILFILMCIIILIFSALPKVIERSWGFHCNEIIAILLNLSLQRNHKSFLFPFCAIPLYSLLLVLSPKPYKNLPDRHFSSILFFRTLHTVGNKEYMGAGMWPKKRKEISLTSTISWSEMKQQNNEDIKVC